MAALTATDWVVSLATGRYRNPVIGSSGEKTVKASMTLATTGTYPSNGVPLPAASNFGLARYIDNIVIYSDAPAAPIIPKYDPDNNSIRYYRQQGLSSGTAGTLIEVATTVTIGSTATTGAGGSNVLYVEAKGW
jgi:hypothetical protein